MKTRFLIIVGIIVFVAISITYVSLAYNQEIKIALGLIISDDEPQFQHIPDPLCLTTIAPSDKKENDVSLEKCMPLRHLEIIGCTYTMLEHISRYTNLFDEEFDGILIREWVGLPEGVSEEDYEKCLEFLHERRIKPLDETAVESKSKPSQWDFRTLPSYVIIPKGSAIPDNKFHLIPSEITVYLGKNNTVTWINEDDTPSTLVSSHPPFWSTGLLKHGETASITFNETGIYEYHGSPHPWKVGSITVLED